MKRELDRLLAEARRSGWQVTPTRGSHYRLQHPAGGLLFAPSTPSDKRSIANLRADLRRAERHAATERGL